MVAALLIVALLVAGGAWRLVETTVPVSDYDEVVAELDATKDALASTTEELVSTMEALASAQEALSSGRSSPTAQEYELRARLEQAELAALLLGYFAGADREFIRGQSWDQSWAGVVARDMAVEAINDPALTDLYWEYLGGGVGDPVEEIATNEFVLRLVELTIEPIITGR